MIDFSNKAGFDLKSRHRAERRFQWTGIGAIALSLAFLFWMGVTIISGATGGFRHVEVALSIDLSARNVDPNNIAGASYGSLVKKSLLDAFPDVTKRTDKRALYGLLSLDAPFELRTQILEDSQLLGQTRLIWLSASDDLSLYVRGKVDANLPQDQRQISDQELAWAAQLKEQGHIRTSFNWRFFTNGDSREPEIAGILAAFVGSALSLAVCFLLSFPIGIAAAVYLEEFARENKFSSFLEVNINNLAAVPSIIFGLLGLSIFLGYFDLPRSSPLVGGMVLSLMTLPTIIIATRASLKSVPPSIKEAALAVGATPVQAVFHHVFPLALPGMLTGSIIGMARALGDTAPLLMIGMVAFIVDVPKSILDPATALPVQIFLWADSPERAFSEKTASAILVLLFFLVIMNLAAILLRRKLEKRF